ncbi:DUF3352 domain-containing protein [Nocardioides sp. BP30]|uniref:DUF3352 domain-containing protein n=1 Tax=Nocardioides sp. BP30 TaxID=3036374 RepID=UPI002469B890|nr:DUF3352 domain-containing protein [Nocardioides sp. BP30]WGL53874.1 DUF3352 domain-containing protein [Nocardioides sp. BP30]
MSDQQQPPSEGPAYGSSSSGFQPNYGQGGQVPPTDVLTLEGGAWNDPKGDRRGRTWWYVGAGAVAAIALVAGGTVFAASHIGKSHDPGPAAGLPSDTLAYAAIDLDPSAGQKIAAIQALRKFPGFTQGHALDPSSDLRKLFVQDQLAGDGCNVDWGKDVEPWLGNDIGAAVVPGADGGTPQPVTLFAVTDESAAKKDLPKLLGCDNSDPYGLSIADGWAVIGKSNAVATSVSTAAKSASLADTSDFKTWVDRTGTPGVATFFASKDAGRTLARYVDHLSSGLLLAPASASGFSTAGYTAAARSAASDDDPLDPFGGSGGADPFSALQAVCPLAGANGGLAPDSSQLKQQEQALSKLQGGAATLRFAHSGFEVESATPATDADTAGAGDTGLATLPADTAVALGGGTDPQAVATWFTAFTQGIAQGCGSSADKVTRGLTQLTGLALPGDLETLFGKGVTLAVSGSVDPDALSDSTDPTGLAAGIKVQGDPQQIAAVLDKLKLPGAGQFLGTTSGDGVVAVGPDPAYRAELAKKGSLGKSTAFTDVIPHADTASAAAFVSFDHLRTILDSDAAGVSADARANLRHLRAFGESSWTDGGIVHGLMRLSTQ